MPYYEFVGCDNNRCRDNRGRANKGANIYLIKYPMADAPGVGTFIPCPCCAKGRLKRTFSTGIGAIVRGTQTPTRSLDKGVESFMTNIDGQDTKITFIDHPHTDPAYQAGLAKAARQAGIGGGLGKAYRSEKHGGRLVVDVQSSVPDPLGAIARQQRRDGIEPKRQTTRVNTPVSRGTRTNRPSGPIKPKGGEKVFIPLRKV
jgi:hypothetical protein